VAGRKSNSPVGLANSLRGFSTGLMTNHWENLKRLKMPVLLITGEKDKKFRKINDEMLKFIPDAEHVCIPSAGHIVHLENGGDFIIFLNSFLRNL
jgi:2-succinyl-6-hydroxy-2,4-cyclohexadiene-1-carboxylate synthase